MALQVPNPTFGSRQTPTIVCINNATTPLGVELPELVAALQTYVDSFYGPIWGVSCNLEIGTGSDVPDGAWGLMFLDDTDQPGADAYHRLTQDGQPQALVFVRSTLQANEKVSVTASHELAEMLVDPGIQWWAEAPDRTLWALETADAVEETSFPVLGIEMSNFVLPEFFQGFRQPGSTAFDYLLKVQAPFTLLAGGYTIKRDGSQTTHAFGSPAKRVRFAKEDRRMHRGEIRQPGGKMKLSRPGRISKTRATARPAKDRVRKAGRASKKKKK